MIVCQWNTKYLIEKHTNYFICILKHHTFHNHISLYHGALMVTTFVSIYHYVILVVAASKDWFLGSFFRSKFYVISRNLIAVCHPFKWLKMFGLSSIQELFVFLH